MSDSEAIAGLWRRGGKAHATPASLQASSDGTLRILGHDGTTLAQCAFAEALVSERVGSIPRHVGLPDGSDFETDDNDAVDRLCRRYGRRSAGLVAGLEQFRPRLLIFAALAVALCVGVYRYAVPALVELAVWSTPPAVSEAISKSVMLSLDRLVFETTALPEARRKALDDAFSSIGRLTPRAQSAVAAGEPLPYTLNFRKGGAIGPNAFALPDGTIVVTDELVEMTQDDEMILGVLAHEIGHVDRDHSLRQLYRVAGIAALIMLIGGDIGSATEDILTQGAGLLALSYSRSAEAEADRYSVELMHRAGRDPAAIARFFELLQARFGLDDTRDFFSTHPATAGRIDTVRRYAAEIGGEKPVSSTP